MKCVVNDEDMQDISMQMDQIKTDWRKGFDQITTSSQGAQEGNSPPGCF
jgi:hypothetical protein